MERIYLLLCTLVFAGCSIFDKDEMVPGFIHVSAADLQTQTGEGANTSAITDVHVFANEQFVGTYELPANVPILENGPTRLNISAGIKNNGITEQRIIYPFYQPIIMTVDLEPAQITQVSDDSVLTFSYFPSELNFAFEDFEGTGITLEIEDTSSANIGVISDPQQVRSGNGSGMVTMTNNKPVFLAFTTWPLVNLPLGRRMYLEIDFKGDVALEIGIETINPQVRQLFALGLNPQPDWTKVYVDVSDLIASQFQTNSLRFYFRSQKPTSLGEASIFIDNIKFIYSN